MISTILIHAPIALTHALPSGMLRRPGKDGGKRWRSLEIR
ncbi:hypothetical protein GFS31_25530 [Leptolyngbya sp. BL0902]|nr:hypothetical protein GFS31_25530 [Leptolyngbya sp. BL0902]